MSVKRYSRSYDDMEENSYGRWMEHSVHAATVAQLEAENAELRERIRCLEQALDASIARKSIIGPL